MVAPCSKTQIQLHWTFITPPHINAVEKTQSDQKNPLSSLSLKKQKPCRKKQISPKMAGKKKKRKEEKKVKT